MYEYNHYKKEQIFFEFCISLLEILNLLGLRLDYIERNMNSQLWKDIMLIKKRK